MLLHALPLLAILPLSLAKKVTVDVGKGNLAFSPDTITAEKGDTVEFTFYPDSHTVVESTFDKPCNYKSGGINSGTGFQTSNGASPKIFTVNIDNSDTRFLYCSIGGHCQRGMSLVINQKDQTLKDYKAASVSAATSSSDSTSVSGGTVSDKSASSSASSSASNSASSSATSKATSATSASASSVSAQASSATSSSAAAASTTSSSSASKASATSASATATGGASKVGAGAALGIAGVLLGGLI